MRVVIIGAGVIGLCCAYELCRRGAQVTLLDRGEPGQAASWGNAGWITPALSGPVPAPGLTATALRWMLRPDSPLYIKPRLDPMFARWLWTFWRRCNARDYCRGLEAVAALNRRTMPLYDALRQDGLDFEMHHAGLLFVFLTESGLRHGLDDLALMQPYGYRQPAVLRRTELRELEPSLTPDVVGGYLVEEERHVRADTVTAALVARLGAMNAVIRPRTAVTGLRRRGAVVDAVLTGEGPLEADQFVIAAGAWSGLVARQAGFHLPVEAGKGYSISIVDPSLRLRHPMYLDETRVGVTPFDSMLRFAGTMELSGLDSPVMPRRVAALKRAATRFLGQWPSGDSEVTWSGLRPLMPDGLPAIGRAPRLDNLFIATGHSMLGVTLGPSTGAVIADLICTGQTDVDMRPFDPARFV